MPIYPFDTQRLINICRENGVSKVGVFGSMVNGNPTVDSDIDLLIEFENRKSLLALVKLERELSTALERKVDVQTEAALSPYLKDRNT